MNYIDNDIWQLAEQELNGKLSPNEVNRLDARLKNDLVFAKEYQECVSLLRSLEANGKRKRYKEILEQAKTENKTKTRKISLVPMLKISAMAASVALATSLITAYAVHHSDKKATISQYQVLVNMKHELDNVKRDQNQLNQKLTADKAIPEQIPGKYTGTGFALSNNGYIATNFHVIDGADSIYIQTRDGLYHKAYMVDADTRNDLAVLKTEDRGFRFVKGAMNLPYSLATSKAALGSRVFTIGYPQDELMYNEGYVSASTGYQGDSNQYRLELPANPGTSGAPVVDQKGQLIAIVTGKEPQSEGTTYAVSSHALSQMLHHMPKDENLSILKQKIMTLTKEEQVAQMQDYTCVIQVYK